jgi:hypothetical protein
MKKLILFFFAFAIIFISSCKKELIGPVNNGADNLNDIQVEPSFTWSTGQVVDVNITGLPTTIPVKSTLSISLNDGTTVYQSFHAMNLDITIKVTVPSSETQLILKYGTMEYMIQIVDNQADFSFIPQVQE